jgi:hypothetical protein
MLGRSAIETLKASEGRPPLKIGAEGEPGENLEAATLHQYLVQLLLAQEIARKLELTAE